MKYAIMSDVHANPKALETALEDARASGCGKFILLGDITGYGYDPKGTLEIVRENFDVVLLDERKVPAVPNGGDDFSLAIRHGTGFMV